MNKKIYKQEEHNTTAAGDVMNKNVYTPCYDMYCKIVTNNKLLPYILAIGNWHHSSYNHYTWQK